MKQTPRCCSAKRQTVPAGESAWVVLLGKNRARAAMFQYFPALPLQELQRLLLWMHLDRNGRTLIEHFDNVVSNFLTCRQNKPQAKQRPCSCSSHVTVVGMAPRQQRDLLAFILTLAGQCEKKTLLSICLLLSYV